MGTLRRSLLLSGTSIVFNHCKSLRVGLGKEHARYYGIKPPISRKEGKPVMLVRKKRGRSHQYRAEVERTQLLSSKGGKISICLWGGVVFSQGPRDHSKKVHRRLKVSKGSTEPWRPVPVTGFHWHHELIRGSNPSGRLSLKRLVSAQSTSSQSGNAKQITDHKAQKDAEVVAACE